MKRQPLHITATDAATRVYEVAAQRNPGQTPAQLRSICRPLLQKFIRSGMFVIVETREEAQTLNLRADAEQAWSAA